MKTHTRQIHQAEVRPVRPYGQILRLIPPLTSPLFAAIFTVTAAPRAQAGVFALDEGGATTLSMSVRDTNLDFSGRSESQFPASLPLSTTISLAHGGSWVQADLQLTESGFHATSSGARPGRLDSRSTLHPSFVFSVSEDTGYSISGTLMADDTGFQGSAVVLTATLTDLDTSEILYHSHQSSLGVVDQEFTLGGMSGSLENEFSGSSSGLLEAGHRYSLFYLNTIYASQGTDAASFQGSLAFTAVPEPGAVSMGAAGLLAAWMGIRWTLGRKRCG